MAAQKHTQTRVAFATIVGTSIEWYDYFLYAAASGLIFNHLFFGPLGSTLSTMVAFATVGISFLFRPLGAFLAGHFGDKLGRRVVLIITLIAMGAATALIGFLPTYESAGILAPILLIALRIVQGISAGSGGGLLAVEHADEGPVTARVLQIGVSTGPPVSGVLALDLDCPGRGLPRMGLASAVLPVHRARLHRLLDPPRSRGIPRLP